MEIPFRFRSGCNKFGKINYSHRFAIMKTCLFCICALLIVQGCTPISAPSASTGGGPKVLRLEDAIYERDIHTVRLYADGNPMSPAAAQLGQAGLMLEFDDLKNQREDYYARIIHCDYNWTQSRLQDLDFIAAYNEFPINNIEFSVDTHIPYVHYWFQVPPVKLSGNYVLVVYRGSNRDDIVLTRRFLVYENRITLKRNQNLVGQGSVAQVNQQINFTIDHSNLQILNPMQDVNVTIRQNQRWDNAATDLKPMFTREIEKELEYRFFDDGKMFRGNNEFRFFDMRSLFNPGRNVAYVDRNVKPFEVYVARDKTRGHEAYAQYNELNGNYIIQNYDQGDESFANYAWVNFTLAAAKIEGDVYLMGALTNWQANEQSKMRYDSTAQQYTGRLLLKQGWYDYLYHVKSNTLPSHYFEGSHFQTENRYEVLVYYRPFQPRADLLIGYYVLQENPR